MSSSLLGPRIRKRREMNSLWVDGVLSACSSSSSIVFFFHGCSSQDIWSGSSDTHDAAVTADVLQRKWTVFDRKCCLIRTARETTLVVDRKKTLLASCLPFPHCQQEVNRISRLIENWDVSGCQLPTSLFLPSALDQSSLEETDAQAWSDVLLCVCSCCPTHEVFTHLDWDRFITWSDDKNHL